MPPGAQDARLCDVERHEHRESPVDCEKLPAVEGRFWEIRMLAPMAIIMHSSWMKNANWLTRLIAATAFCEYRLRMKVSTLISEVRRRFSTKIGQASFRRGICVLSATAIGIGRRGRWEGLRPRATCDRRRCGRFCLLSPAAARSCGRFPGRAGSADETGTPTAG